MSLPPLPGRVYRTRKCLHPQVLHSSPRALADAGFAVMDGSVDAVIDHLLARSFCVYFFRCLTGIASPAVRIPHMLAAAAQPTRQSSQ
jgi:hypothetical protein